MKQTKNINFRSRSELKLNIRRRLLRTNKTYPIFSYLCQIFTTSGSRIISEEICAYFSNCNLKRKRTIQQQDCIIIIDVDLIILDHKPAVSFRKKKSNF